MKTNRVLRVGVAASGICKYENCGGRVVRLIGARVEKRKNGEHAHLTICEKCDEIELPRRPLVT